MRKGFRVPPQKSGQAKRSQAASPQSALQQKAYAFRSQGKFPEAKPLLQQLYESDSSNIVYALDFGEACMETEDFSAAARIYAKIIEQDPKHLIALNNLGGALIRCGRIDDARSMLEYSLELDPQNLHARINLGGILQAAGDLKGNLDNALKAVAIDPTSALAFNNLGSAFSDMAMFNEAKHAFETALMLDSKQVDALINLGGIESRLGNPASAAEKYEQVVKLLPAEAKHRADAVKFYASFEYLKQGILEKGWDYYEGGFSPLVPAKGARSPNRKFSVPRWDGEMLNGKTLLVWREQGLGDELLFATCLHELAALGGQVIVECDARLVETFTRSFPGYRVRAEAFLLQAGNISPNNDFDLHVPMGSLMKYFRRDKQSFTRSGAYVVTHSAYVEDFRQRLAPYQANTRLVGICWRSGKLDPVRNLSYTTIDEWAPLLQMPGYTFVNLQYGECEAELQAIEQKLNIKILRWPDLNLKNDLDRVFALMHCLDAVVSVQTAVLTMAGSVGVPVVGVKAGGWTNFGSFDSPWFTSQRGNCEDVNDIGRFITNELQYRNDEIVYRDIWEQLWPTGEFERLHEYFLEKAKANNRISTQWRSHYSMLLARLGYFEEACELANVISMEDRNLHDVYWRVGWHYLLPRGKPGVLDFFLADLDRGKLTDFGYSRLVYVLSEQGDDNPQKQALLSHVLENPGRIKNVREIIKSQSLLPALSYLDDALNNWILRREAHRFN